MPDLILLLMIVISSVVVGAVVGLMPGLNPVLGLILILPVLSGLDAYTIVIFWVCYICATQYYGSVAALWFRIPGETSSLPVLNHSRHLRSVSAVLRCYKLTAMGSIIAALLALIVFAVIAWGMQHSWMIFFKTQWLAAFFVFVMMLLIVSSPHRLTTVMLMLLGLAIAIFPQTDAALNLCAVDTVWCLALRPTDINLSLLCLYGLPFVFGNGYFAPRGLSSRTGANLHQWRSLWKFRYVAVKHAVVGFVMGLIPGMGVTLSANTSAALESRTNKPRHLRVMCAAESSNNSAIIVSTIPFLLLGIPITGTELVLDSWLIVHQAQSVNANFFYNDIQLAERSWPFALILIACAIVANLLCFALVSGFSNLYQNISRIPATWFENIIKVCIIGLLLFSIAYSGLNSIAIALTLVIFSLVGIWGFRKNVDITALPICMILGPFAADKITAAYFILS